MMRTSWGSIRNIIRMSPYRILWPWSKTSLALLFIWSIWGWFVRSNTHPHPRMVWKQSDLTISTLFLYICLIKATLILIYGPNESNSLKLYAHLHLNMFMHTHKLSIALKCLLAAFM
uniref:Uncharacterized protein n=1 Tax=Physcomitrium patens TaxID=3218 RepID=A0A7I4BKH7_PHYPA